MDRNHPTLRKILNENYKSPSWETEDSEDCRVLSLSALDLKGRPVLIKFLLIEDESIIQSRFEKLCDEIENTSAPLSASKLKINFLKLEGKSLLMTERSREPKTLQMLLEQNEEFVKEKLNDISDKLIEILKNLNSKKLFHYNIKPQNISVDVNSMELLLLDWESYLCKELITSRENAICQPIRNPDEGIARDLFCVGIVFLTLLGVPNTDEWINLKERNEERQLTPVLDELERETFSQNTVEIRNLALQLLRSGKNNIIEILKNMRKKRCIGFCQDFDIGHRDKYEHVSCKDEGECPVELYKNYQHRMECWHPTMCKKTNKCENYDNDQHRKQYFHHKLDCKYLGLCTMNFEANHFKKYKHPDVCKIDCKDYSQKHMLEFSHQHNVCEKSYQCELSNKREILYQHIRNFRHPFLPLCKEFFKCLDKSSSHLDSFSHPCQWGKFCELRLETNKDWEQHCKQYIHIMRPLCKYDPDCTKLHDQDHLEEYAHKSISEVREKCKNWLNCFDISEAHLSKVSHPHRKRLVITNLYGDNRDINFEANAKYLEGMLDEYMKKNNLVLLDEVITYCSNLRPQHRCSFNIFKLILEHGTLLSKVHQKKIAENMYAEALEQVKTDKEIVKILINYEIDENDFYEFADLSIKGIIEEFEYQKNKIQSKIIERKFREMSTQFFKKYPKIEESDKERIKNKIEIKAKAAYDHKFLGIGYGTDEKIGTDKTIFSIVGNNPEKKYGPIILVMKQEVMHHPDFNMTPTAGTNFISKNCFRYRPWLLTKNKDAFTEDEMIKLFHKSKINASIRNWATILAKELTCKAFNLYENVCKGIQFKKDDAKMIISYDSSVDSHFMFEGHMPPKVPFSMVEKVVITKDLNEELSKPQNTSIYSMLREYLNEQGKDALIVVNDGGNDVLNEMRKNNYGIYSEFTQRRGFCFSILPRFGSDILLPIEIPNPKSFRISFEFLGSDLHLRLTSEKSECFNSEKDNFFYLILAFRGSFNYEKTENENFNSFLVKQSQGPRGDFLQKQIIKDLYKNLDRSFDYVKYIIEVTLSEKGEKKQIIKFGFDRNSLDNAQMLINTIDDFAVYETDKIIEEMKYITISSWDTPIHIRNFVVEPLLIPATKSME